MTRIRGFLTIPEELYSRSEQAKYELFKHNIFVYGFDSFIRREQKATSGFKGFFLNGMTSTKLDDRDIMEIFYGTNDVNEVLRKYNNPTLTFDISLGLNVWPIYPQDNISSYFAKRLAFDDLEERCRLVNLSSLNVDFIQTSFREAEDGVLVLESFDNPNSIGKIIEQNIGNYLLQEDTILKNLIQQ